MRESDTIIQEAREVQMAAVRGHAPADALVMAGMAALFVEVLCDIREALLLISDRMPIAAG